MIYYKWTIVKDTPQVEKGFSYSFSDEILQRKCATCYSHDKELNDKIHWLRYYGENNKLIFENAQAESEVRHEEETC